MNKVKQSWKKLKKVEQSLLKLSKFEQSLAKFKFFVKIAKTLHFDKSEFVIGCIVCCNFVGCCHWSGCCCGCCVSF